MNNNLAYICLVPLTALFPGSQLPDADDHDLANRMPGELNDSCGPNYFGTLNILWAGVVDNGEGDDWPHGPFGSLHVLVYERSANCPGHQKSYSGYLSHTIMPGPSNGEWMDGDAMQMQLPIHRWRSEDDHVLVVVYESDPGGVGRSHDMIFCWGIHRSATVGGYSVVGDTYRTVKPDAFNNCNRRGVPWLRGEVWSGGLNQGTPKVFLQVQAL